MLTVSAIMSLLTTAQTVPPDKTSFKKNIFLIFELQLKPVQIRESLRIPLHIITSNS